MNFLPRDFVETREGLIFAVVDADLERDKVLCFLRYARDWAANRHGKLDTSAANALLRERFPSYLYHSERLDADLHAVPVSAIVRHHGPRQRLSRLLTTVVSADPMEARLCNLAKYFIRRGVVAAELGVTGSLLLGVHSAKSDIDLVAYGRTAFAAARDIIVHGIGNGVFEDLSVSDWRENYLRRGGALGFDEFVWHERRKSNKAMFERTKFDLTQVSLQPDRAATVWRKRGNGHLRALVLDDAAAFDHPARYRIDHPEFSEICVHTHTYVGQARQGETVEAVGAIEQADFGMLRLSIGSCREAPGEYLRVLRESAGRTTDGRSFLMRRSPQVP